MSLHFSSALAGLVLAAGASVAVADTIVPAPEQETVIREHVKKEPLASVKLPGIELNVGSTVPDTVELYEAPDVTYRYVVVDGRTVVVEPESCTIVKVLDLIAIRQQSTSPKGPAPAARPITDGACRASPLRLDQIPQIAVEVGEHRHRAVGLVARRLPELDAALKHRRMVAGEIVRLQEQEDAAAGLVADRRDAPRRSSLRRAAGARRRRAGATVTQRLPPPRSVSSSSSKPSFSVYQAIASS